MSDATVLEYEAPRRRRVTPLVSLAIAGILTRLLLACLSYGTNDFYFYRDFAAFYLREGVEGLLTHQRDYNLTPIMTFYGVVLWVASGETEWLFGFLFKLPLIGADAGSAFLLYKIWKNRTDAYAGALAAVVFAWNLDAILVTGFHCNTDPLYGFFALLAAYFMTEKRNAMAAGFALAAAINVKLIPVVLVPAFFFACRSKKEFIAFVLALSVGAIPFAVSLSIYGELFFRKVVAYNSNVENWGPNLGLLHLRERVPEWKDAATAVVLAYKRWGGIGILALVTLLSAWGRKRGWSLYETAARSIALFFVLTPGWGVQYSVFLVPFVTAVFRPYSVVYGVAMGLYLLVLYYRVRTGAFPWVSFFQGPHPLPQAYLGVVPWGLLAAYLFSPAKLRENREAGIVQKG